MKLPQKQEAICTLAREATQAGTINLKVMPAGCNFVSKQTQAQEIGTGEERGPIFGALEAHTLGVLFAGLSEETFSTSY